MSGPRKIISQHEDKIRLVNDIAPVITDNKLLTSQTESKEGSFSDSEDSTSSQNEDVAILEARISELNRKNAEADKEIDDLLINHRHFFIEIIDAVAERKIDNNLNHFLNTDELKRNIAENTNNFMHQHRDLFLNLSQVFAKGIERQQSRNSSSPLLFKNPSKNINLPSNNIKTSTEKDDTPYNEEDTKIKLRN